MGGCEAATPVVVEPPLKYHPSAVEVLTQVRHPGRGQCMVGSLTGAVSSQSVTEEREGSLGTVGNRTLLCNGTSELDCERDISSRCESRP